MEIIDFLYPRWIETQYPFLPSWTQTDTFHSLAAPYFRKISKRAIEKCCLQRQHYRKPLPRTGLFFGWLIRPCSNVTKSTPSFWVPDMVFIKSLGKCLKKVRQILLFSPKNKGTFQVKMQNSVVDNKQNMTYFRAERKDYPNPVQFHHKTHFLFQQE